jgi:hypothetical protein
LTIDEANRLQKQVQELKQQDDYQKYVIDKKMKEKDEQITALQDSVKFLSDTVNRALLADTSNKIITSPVIYNINKKIRKRGAKNYIQNGYTYYRNIISYFWCGRNTDFATIWNNNI